MELEWNLIIFTVLTTWSAGLFATQCVFSLQGRFAKVQLPAWICSAILLAIGGIAVFFHLQHWERIFNGFGHITSGITQEFICIIALAVVAIIYLLLMRRNGGKAPAWIAWAGIVVSVLLVIVMAHSYVMAARPAWNSLLWVLAVLGEACAFGPFTMSVLCDLRAEQDDKEYEDSSDSTGKARFSMPFIVLVGAVIHVAATLVYALYFQFSASQLSQFDSYFDPVLPTQSIVDASSTVSAMALPLWAGGLVVGALIPLLCAIMLKRKQGGNGAAIAIAGMLCVAAGAVCLRVAFFGAGVSVFSLF